MRVTWNAINALLQSDWLAQHSWLGHENLSRVPRRIFPRGFPPPTCHTRMRARGNNTAGPRDYSRGTFLFQFRGSVFTTE